MEQVRERERATSADILLAREAVGAVTPFTADLGLWQTRAARLAALGRRARATATYHPNLLAEAEALHQQIEHRCAAFEEKTAELPKHIATNSRISDARRALQQIARTMSTTVSLLGNRTGEA